MVDNSTMSLYYIVMINLEQELKLLLDKRQYDKIVVDAHTTVIHTNHYFYADGMPEDTAVRIRNSNGNFQLTAKVHVSTSLDVAVCKEHNVDITASLADSLINNGISKQQLLDMVGIEVEHNMRYLGHMNTTRSIVDIEGHRVELDYNQYLDQCDYELEYECNDLVLVQQLRSILLYRYALKFQPSNSKYYRFITALAKIPMLIEE